MYIENEDRIDHPLDLVYPLVRDDLPKLLPYLPDVEELVQISYERTSETRVTIVNEWRAKAAVPKMVAKFLPPDVFRWTDSALWKDVEHRVEYRLEGFGYEVDGNNSFTADGDGTVLKITATVTIHPEKFKIPRLLFKKVFPAVEGAVKRAVQPNLTALARGLQSYFAENT
ncbi:MAG: SRPBCC family protein [Myxococcota bacterium]